MVAVLRLRHMVCPHRIEVQLFVMQEATVIRCYPMLAPVRLCPCISRSRFVCFTAVPFAFASYSSSSCPLCPFLLYTIKIKDRRLILRLIV